jgi:Ner family transcriptional regulator
MDISINWHKSKIVSELKIKTGKSLRKLSVENGYKPKTLQQALERPYPKAEKIIAAAIGVTPSTIWPSRYENVLLQSKASTSLNTNANCEG